MLANTAGHRVEVREAAERAAEVPVSPFAPYTKLTSVLSAGHAHVRRREVEQKEVGDGPHPLVRRDDPDNDQVPGDGHQQNQRERDRPERHAPRRLREPVGVGQVRGVSGQGHGSL